MSLAQTQAALARLLTLAEARAEFRRDPRAAARAAGLDGQEAEALAALPAAEISRYAAALIAKRRLDVEKWLPLTARALGADFAARLRETLAEPPPGARADAQALVARLQTLASPPWIGDLAVYEAEFMRAWRSGAHFAVRRFRWPAPRIAGRLAAGEPIGEISPGFALAVWLRPPQRRLRHWWWGR